MTKLYDVFNSEAEFQFRAPLKVVGRFLNCRKEAMMRIEFETEKDNDRGCAIHSNGREMGGYEMVMIHRADDTLDAEIC